MHVGDTIFIFCLALIIFGPKKLPEIGRQIGKLMVEFRRASNEFKMQIDEELRASEESERQKEMSAAAALAAPNASERDAIARAAGPDERVAAATLPGTPAATPTIAPPATGMPVNHTFSSAETSRQAAEGAAAGVPSSADAYPEPGNGFNPGLNTASNGLAAEASMFAPDSRADEPAALSPLAEQLATAKAQAHAHHD